MARIERCANGHFYDKDLNETCPYCDPGASINLDRRVPSAAEGENEPQKIFDEGRIPTVPLDEDTKRPEKKIDNYSGKTVGLNPFNKVPDRQEGAAGREKTPQKRDPQQYVTGWLVGVKGPYMGRSFETYVGYTKIGRKEGNDIVLDEDPTVSGHHANVHYSTRKNLFQLQCAETPKNSVLVDDVELLSNEKAGLSPYSRIVLGNSEFLFIPFCTDKFRWEDAVSKTENAE